MSKEKLQKTGEWSVEKALQALAILIYSWREFDTKMSKRLCTKPFV